MPLIKLCKRLRPGDVGVAFLCAGTVLASAAQFWAPQLAERATVSVAGKTVVTLPLDRVNRFDAIGPIGVTTIETQPGRARVSHTPNMPAPCVQQGWQSRAGATLVCEANSVTLSLESGAPLSP